MIEWLMIVACAVLTVVAGYLWNLKTKIGGELKAQRDINDQLRQDHALALERQAKNFGDQIAGLNVKLTEARQETKEAADEARKLELAANASQVTQNAQKQRIADMEKHYEDLLSRMKDEFKALSEEVLKEKREQFEKEGITSIKTYTGSLQQEVKAFQDRLNQINKEDVERTTALKKDIEALVGQTQMVSSEANNLAMAIRAEAQVTGQWGEQQLLRVLELGGLNRTMDYDYQETFTSPGADHADLRTDVLVKMPENRWLVIDAKTTMAAYVDYVGAQGERNAEALERILRSLIDHVKEMKTVEYHKKLEATTGKHILSTMLMYIPFEEVYLMAMKFEVDGPNGKIPLREWAWQNDVIFVNATALLPLVKMLAELWARDRSERKVLQIKEAAESLIEKFRTFLEGSGGKRDGFLAIGAGLMTAVGAFNESIKRLSEGRGSIIKKLTDLKEMGVSSTDKLPPPEQIESRQIALQIHSS